MPLRSDVVGESLRPLVLEVTPRRALAFAAGLGDVSAASLDDAAPGFVASPLLCVSLEWQSVIGGRNALLGLSDEEGRRGVHAGQDTRFLAPLPVGRKVRVEGRVVTVRRTPAGALSTSRIHVRDSRSGRLISTTLSTAIYRGVAVEGDDHSIEPPDPAVAPDAGEDWAETTIPLDRGFAHRYSECADIWNPIHTERSVALAAGLADIIVHGSALWALAGLAVTRGRGGGAAARLRRLTGRFTAMVPAGSPVTVRHGRSATEPAAAVFAVVGGNGQMAVTHGRAEFGDP